MSTTIESETLSLMDRSFAKSINYIYSEYRFQRIVGPPKNITFRVDNKDTEIFVSKLPKFVNIETLFRVFVQCGEIYKIRIMRDGHMQFNNGLAYVSYFSEESAARAIKFLHLYPIIPGHLMMVSKSFDNRRLYIGGIPTFKLRDQIWRELISVGMHGIVDVITYRSYKNPSHNRGFAFVEFESHNLAASTIARFQHVKLFSVPITIDWSIPLAEVSDEIMQSSCKLFIRNLQVHWTADDIVNLVDSLIHPRPVSRVYKFKDYAFVHFFNRADAEIARSLLGVHFSGTPVEIEWGRPQSKVTSPAFRNEQIAKLVARRRNESSTQQSTSASSSNSDMTCCSVVGSWFKE